MRSNHSGMVSRKRGRKYSLDWNWNQASASQEPIVLPQCPPSTGQWLFKLIEIWRQILDRKIIFASIAKLCSFPPELLPETLVYFQPFLPGVHLRWVFLNYYCHFSIQVGRTDVKVQFMCTFFEDNSLSILSAFVIPCF